ncbi:MAG TPA: class I SAM-dependent methyltransferase [bacterium]|nr:class I SAM-dependent methyltransferase [bacterium]
MDSFKIIARKVAGKLGFDIVRKNNLILNFHNNYYLRHTARRLEHLSSLRIPVAGMTVLEVGAGIGDLSHYYIDRRCKITITEARLENLQYLKKRFPDENIQYLNMESPSYLKEAPFDIVHCYGLIYHLSNPEQALQFLSSCCKKMLFLSTCVSFANSNIINWVTENQSSLTQAISGTGCLPTRPWVFKKLSKLFKYVYIPKTQPNHEEFPIDWTAPEMHRANLSRAIFISSNIRIDNVMLTEALIDHQTRSA